MFLSLINYYLSFKYTCWAEYLFDVTICNAPILSPYKPKFLEKDCPTNIKKP